MSPSVRPVVQILRGQIPVRVAKDPKGDMGTASVNSGSACELFQVQATSTVTEDQNAKGGSQLELV